MDDLTLLRAYATRNSEAAFAELVSRRVGFVYSAALRQVRDPHLAEEITQAVFIILAQKAGRISDQTILAGWLFKTTRFAAIAQTRDRVKRQRREQEAHMQTELQSAAPDPLWEQLSPLLDEALATLGETDRQAVLLRFFENKTLAEVGSHLGTGEDTARKRVSRALEKLHRYFNKRGVASTTVIIAGALSANSVQAAPALLAKSVTAVAIAKGAGASGSTLIIAKGALKIMTWAKLKLVAGVGAGILLAGGAVRVVLSGDNAATAQDEPAVISFKRYLSTPPIITRLVYSELYFDLQPDEPAHKAVLGVHGENFYHRFVKDGEDFLNPISKSNRMRGSSFIGRVGDLNWMIVGFSVTKSYNPNPIQPDPYAANAANFRRLVTGILNLGPDTIEPGSFTWKGNAFEALPTKQALGWFPTNLVQTGTVRVENGHVVEMNTSRAGWFRYEYEAAANLPKGFPARILRKNGYFGRWRPCIQFHEVHFADTNSIDDAQFFPEFHITPEVTLLTVISNSQTTVKLDARNPEVIKLVELDVEGRKKEATSGLSTRSSRTIIVIGVFVAAALMTGFFLLFKLRQKE